MIAALALVSLTSGCYFRAHGWEISSVHAQCEKRGGVEFIDAYPFKPSSATCADGVTVYAKKGSQ